MSAYPKSSFKQEQEESDMDAWTPGWPTSVASALVQKSDSDFSGETRTEKSRLEQILEVQGCGISGVTVVGRSKGSPPHVSGMGN